MYELGSISYLLFIYLPHRFPKLFGISIAVFVFFQIILKISAIKDTCNAVLMTEYYYVLKIL